MRRFCFTFCLFGVLPLLTSCGDPASPTQSVRQPQDAQEVRNAVAAGARSRKPLQETKKRPAPNGPNLILISIDTLRADHLGCYGYDRPTSPAIDKLAAQGVLFEDASAPSPWTLPSHASMLTGLYPKQHGLKAPVHTSFVFGQKTTEAARAMVKSRLENISLAEVLRGQGYLTAAFVNCSYLGNTRYGFTRGFDTFSYTAADPESPLPSGIELLGSHWMSRHAGEPFFLFLHFYDVHAEYRSLPKYEKQFVREYDGNFDGSFYVLSQIINKEISANQADVEHLKDLYDAGIRQMDDAIARLVKYLEDGELLDNTVVIVTSDHGEEFLEHGNVSHGLNQYQQAIRVPLIMRGPGLPKNQRINTMASLVDLMPTALALLDVPCPPGTSGIDLTQTWRDPQGASPARFLFAEAEFPVDLVFDEGTYDIKKAVRNDRFKLHYDISTDHVELYDLLEDPGEAHDIANKTMDVVELLRDSLDRFMRTGNRRIRESPLTSEEKRVLRSLGYLK